MRKWSSISVLQHKGWLHNVPVYRLVLTARRIMARRTSFSRVEWRNETFVLNMWRPQFHLNPQESANIPQHLSPDGTLAHSLELSKLFCTLFCLRDTNVLLFVVVKVACIPWSSALRQEGGFNLRTQNAMFIFSVSNKEAVYSYKEKVRTYLSLVDRNPVCCGEPLVIFYVIHAILQVAKSLCQVYLKQVSQQILQVGAKVRGESYLKDGNTKNINYQNKLQKNVGYVTWFL